MRRIGIMGMLAIARAGISALTGCGRTGVCEECGCMYELRSWLSFPVSFY